MRTKTKRQHVVLHMQESLTSRIGGFPLRPAFMLFPLMSHATCLDFVPSGIVMDTVTS